ncbi:hypothetical protein QMK33_19240 [Hymenobacter sp. H14-R3]|uniref:DUF6712 family protein n=1 Tax=Hymenobacter sp. H14-R3 TaxID=3046308 RepID=UPI0024B88B7A|nr:DUF6712 family protein [Hymenobacter sp. H14-R3]MDJ0367288.1 hypothetical protein [Hymenobacter sp. H14-R3]
MPLLKTIAELKRYVPVDTTGILPSFALELEQTEADVIAPLLGPALLAWLQAAYDAPDFDPAGPGLAAQLLRAVQAPLARLATATATTVHQVSIDETGVHITSTDTSKTAFQWQLDRVQAQFLKRGFSGLDALVAWLEAHAEASPELQAWAASPAGQRHRRELFISTADFQEYENISSSRLAFEALGPMRRRLENFELGPVLSPEFLAELRDQVRSRALTSDNENLLRTYVYPALACLTIGHAVPELGLSLNGGGIDLTIARLDDSNAKEADAGLDQLLQSKVSEALISGSRYLRQLTSYLDRTASALRFPTYFASSAYTAPDQPALVVNTLISKVYKFC